MGSRAAIHVQDAQSRQVDGDDGVVGGVDRAAVALLRLAQTLQRGLQVGPHPHESAHQVPELAGGLERHRPGEIAGRHAARRFGQHFHRPDQAIEREQGEAHRGGSEQQRRQAQPEAERAERRKRFLHRPDRQRRPGGARQRSAGHQPQRPEGLDGDGPLGDGQRGVKSGILEQPGWQRRGECASASGQQRSRTQLRLAQEPRHVSTVEVDLAEQRPCRPAGQIEQRLDQERGRT